MKLISIGDYYGGKDPFRELFDSVEVIHTVAPLKGKVDKDTVLLFGGGEDINPDLYNEDPHPSTQKQYKHSMRDANEVEAFNIGVRAGAKMLGICRGAQLLCALSGGSLVQHVTNHHGSHTIMTDRGVEYETSSVHHQMMYPFNTKHQLIAWSKEPLSTVYWKNDKIKFKKLDVEPEIVYFPKTKALGIQGHPEFMSQNDPFVQYSLKLVKEYLFNEVH